jgi:hypothetical protein
MGVETMTADEFFEAPEQHSIIKSTIVTHYFDAWTRIMLPRLTRPGEALAYVDLFAGPGRYADGSPSIPLWVLDYATNDPKLCERLVTAFNDKDAAIAKRLQAEIDAFPGEDPRDGPAFDDRVDRRHMEPRHGLHSGVSRLRSLLRPGIRRALPRRARPPLRARVRPAALVESVGGPAAVNEAEGNLRQRISGSGR